MTVRRMGLAAAIAATLTITGCSSDAPEADDSVQVATDPAFPAGSTMEKIHEADRIRIGVKFDQPGIGYKKPGATTPEGFDVEMAKIIAGQLGLAPEKIRWVETVSKNRESYLRNKRVDLVIASYSITPERRRVVGMAGPYYVTGQQLLVQKGDKSISGPKDLQGKKVCSAAGATSIKTVEQKYRAKPVPYGTYTECVQRLRKGVVDAVTTDGALLLGYAAQAPDALKVVGDTFSTERYGVGYRKGDTEMCEFLNRTINHSYRDGAWVKALSKTLWQTSGAVPNPDVDPCPTGSS
ncbi:glutamate ABC transporter substrate-binding protein [Streptomyces sp. NPDC002055]|uniref:glutamate ABC transporter substrate-binding protein n=1 Tax=Streptomyces sp. NPDC002055 TaxID=3154534 RepID=UPI00332DE46B